MPENNRTNGERLGRKSSMAVPVLHVCNMKKQRRARRWWRMPLIPALGRQSQVDLWEFEASLVYKS